jgi:hypothetical protein
LGGDVVLDPEKVGADLELADSSVCAVLVKKDGGAGAVRVTGGTLKDGIFKNIRTGPNYGTGFVIVLVESEQDCMLFGNPSVRYFRRGNS